MKWQFRVVGQFENMGTRGGGSPRAMMGRVFPSKQVATTDEEVTDRVEAISQLTREDV